MENYSGKEGPTGGTAERPAVLLITADQLRRDALGCYGGHAVATPHLDRLAASGTTYQRGYTASPWCLPARASILTGRYPRSHRAYSNFRDTPLSGGQPNLYRALGDAGYHVGHIGKCHYTPVPYGEPRPDRTLPYQRVRDYYLSLGIDTLRLQDGKQVSVWYADDYAQELEQAGHLAGYRDAIWNRDHHKVFTFPGPAEWHPDSWVGRNAVAHIESHPGPEPMFLWVSFSGPHFPFDPPAGYLDRVDVAALGAPAVAGDLDDPTRAHHRSRHGPRGGQWIESGVGTSYPDTYWTRLRHHYHANVALIDDQIGEIIAAAQARFGDNLLVAFTCDHGEMLGNHGIWGKGNCFYDDVLRIPLLLRRPYRAGAGSRTDRLSSQVDLFPTLLTATGLDPGPIDGRHLDDDGHDVVYAEGEGFLTVTDGRYKLVVIDKHGHQFTELFDTATDPSEVRNLAGEAGHAAVQRDLTSTALRAMLTTTLP